MRICLHLLAALEALEKTGSLTLDVRTWCYIDDADGSRRNERDLVGPYLAADHASPGRRGVLDIACARIR